MGDTSGVCTNLGGRHVRNNLDGERMNRLRIEQLGWGENEPTTKGCACVYFALLFEIYASFMPRSAQQNVEGPRSATSEVEKHVRCNI